VTAPTSAAIEPRLHLPAGSTASGGWHLAISPETAGWTYTGLRIAELAAGGQVELALDSDEGLVVPLAGACRVTCDGETIELAGRPGPFAGATDVAYVPRGSRVALDSARGGRFAIATARADERHPLSHVPAVAVTTELRGAGASSRAVRNLAPAGAFDADRLLAVEVVTPGGNWSSYPPHKHDEAGPDEAVLEEIYYFEIAAGPAGPGFGYQRVYGTPDRPIDVLAEVRDGDTVLVPHGWHGPAMAAPGYDMYYLNVMAGPAPGRAWRISHDPAHAWVRDTWNDQAIDPRVVAAAEGATAR
jgi:5-deoxy-glucuronate isomerase